MTTIRAKRILATMLQGLSAGQVLKMIAEIQEDYADLAARSSDRDSESKYMTIAETLSATGDGIDAIAPQPDQRYNKIMGYPRIIAEVREILEKVVDHPYANAEMASGRAMHHTMHGDRSDPDYHGVGIEHHTRALKSLATALEQARQSVDIDAEKRFKGLYVKHQDVRELHRGAMKPPDDAYESQGEPRYHLRRKPHV